MRPRRGRTSLPTLVLALALALAAAVPPRRRRGRRRRPSHRPRPPLRPRPRPPDPASAPSASNVAGASSIVPALTVDPSLLDVLPSEVGGVALEAGPDDSGPDRHRPNAGRFRGGDRGRARHQPGDVVGRQPRGCQRHPPASRRLQRGVVQELAGVLRCGRVRGRRRRPRPAFGGPDRRPDRLRRDMRRRRAHVSRSPGRSDHRRLDRRGRPAALRRARGGRARGVALRR